MTTREAVVAEARKLLGTPWQHLGRVPGVAIDCIGLVHTAGYAAGLVGDLALPRDYEKRPSNQRLQKSCDQYLVRVRGPALGRVALMRFGVEPHHMGIIGDYPLGGFSLIHSYAMAREAIEHRLDDVWLSRCVAFYDFPGVA